MRNFFIILLILAIIYFVSYTRLNVQSATYTSTMSTVDSINTIISLNNEDVLNIKRMISERDSITDCTKEKVKVLKQLKSDLPQHIPSFRDSLNDSIIHLDSLTISKQDSTIQDLHSTIAIQDSSINLFIEAQDSLIHAYRDSDRENQRKGYMPYVTATVGVVIGVVVAALLFH